MSEEIKDESSIPVEPSTELPLAAEPITPYDLKDLGKMIAKRMDLDLTEAAIKNLGLAVYEGTKDWAIESARVSNNKIDDFISPFYQLADSFVLPQIEKIKLSDNVKPKPEL